jgi:hypothetical protein
MIDSIEYSMAEILRAVAKQKYEQAINVINLFVWEIYIQISPSFYF